jgi:hypothetical protein
MRKKIWRSTQGVFLIACAATLEGQTVNSNPPGKLAFILPAILDEALSVAPPILRPDISASISPRWVSLNASVGTQLSNLPNPSPASAIRRNWDPDSGAFIGTPQSLGPILTERAETIDKSNFFFEVTNQNFSFDRLDKLDLRGFQVAYPISSLSAVRSPTRTST